MAQTINVKKDSQLQDMGGTGDCGYRSIAAALIDAHLCGESGAADYTELMQTYRAHYPGAPTSFSELLEIENTEPQDLIVKLAFALRQLAVNEMVRNPQLYVGAFADKDESTSPQAMRGQHTWIDETGIAATANALKLPIKVVSTERSQIPTLTYNGGNPTAKPLIIHFAGGHYIPSIRTDYFNHKGTATEPRATMAEHDIHQTTKPVGPELIYKDPPLAEIWTKIKHSIALDEARERQVKQKLEAYSDADLIDLYKKTMPYSDYLPGKIRAITRENNDDTFFNDAIAAGKITRPEKQTEIRAILIHALAKEEYIHPSSEVAKSLAARGDGLSVSAPAKQQASQSQVLSP